MWLAASTTTVTSLLLRRFNKSVCRAALLLIHHQTSFFTTTTTTTFNSSSTSKFGGGGSFILHDQQQANNNLHTTTTTFNSSSKFGGGGTFILHDQQQANNNLHTTTCSPSSSKFGDTTFILQINEPSVDSLGGKKYDIKMFMLSSGSGDDGTTGEEEDKDKDKDKDDDDDDQNKKKKKKTVLFKLDEDLGFSAIHKDFQLQDSIRMVGSCNGIICLHDPKLQWPQLLRDVYLWNPATRHFRILPQSIHIEEQTPSNAFRDFVGFGFDVDTQDYKVLRICPLVLQDYEGDGGCMCRVQVYSLSTDSWRVLDGIDSLPVSSTQDPFRNGGQGGTYLNGSCFFLGTKPIRRSNGILDLMVLSFDFNKEIFTIRELPECYSRKLVLSGLDEEDLDIRVLSCLGDKTFCFTTPVVFKAPRIDFAGGYVFTTDEIDLLYSKGGGGYWHYSMWVINEQDSSSSRVVEYEKKPWAKLREFRIKTRSKHFYSEPRCVSDDGELALISTDNGRKKKLMLFNLATGTAIKNFTTGDHRDCKAAYVYKESQVSIMGAGKALLRWQLPTPGTTYKLNLDYTYTCTDKFGIGLCLTSDTDGCIGVRSLKTYLLDFSPEEVLVEALFQAIKWAKELELSPIIIESDSEYCVSFFMEEDVDDDYNSTYWSSREGSLLREAKCHLKSSENSISFQYYPRSCNYVAELALKLGWDETTWSCKDWTADFPGEVVMSLSKDLGLET